MIGMEEVISVKLGLQGVKDCVIDGSVIMRCGSLPKVLTIPKGVSGLSDGCMSGSRSLEVVFIPDTVIYVGNSVFANCVSLRKIYVPFRLLYVANKLRYGTFAEVVVNETLFN